MPESLIVTTISGKSKTVNLAALELFGYGEAELIAQPILTLVADDKIAHKTCNSKFFRTDANTKVSLKNRRFGN
jgi:PAS domain S-box-containing protein